MNKNTIYLFIALLIIVAGVWFWMNQPVLNAPTTGTPQGNVAANDTTAAINQDVNAINIQDPDFTNIDSDVNSL